MVDVPTGHNHLDEAHASDNTKNDSITAPLFTRRFREVDVVARKRA